MDEGKIKGKQEQEDNNRKGKEEIYGKGWRAKWDRRQDRKASSKGKEGKKSI